MRTLRHGFSIVELLVVIALALTFLNLAYAAYYQGLGSCAFFSKKAHDYQGVDVIRKAWRAFVRQNGAVAEVEPGAALRFANGASVRRERGNLVFADAKGERAFLLPGDQSVKFSLEPGAAALELNVRRRQGPDGAAGYEYLRIAAATPKEAKP